MKNKNIKKRFFNNYKEALQTHYTEEYIGEIYFNYLYQQFPDKYVLYLLSQIEKLMCKLLYPIIKKNNIIINNYYELHMIAINEGKIDSILNWTNYANYIKENFNIYVEEFEDIYELAPLEDKPIMKKLIEHEKIIINYFSNFYKTNNYTEIELFLYENKT